MDLNTFYDRIKLMSEAVTELNRIIVSEEKYTRLRNLFYEDQKAFFDEVLMEERFRLYFLYYYCRFACDLYEKYNEKEIEASIYWDTFYDITLWCQNCYRDYNEYGIQEYEWLAIHLKMRLFRLGRLQFEMVREGNKYSDGKAFINVHIPQGEPLNMSECIESFYRAFHAYGKDMPYLCDSWLLNPILSKFIKSESNIIQFQKLFEIVGEDLECRQAEERIFDRVLDDPNEYPEKTTLQIKAKEYLISGGKLGLYIGRLWKNF